MRPIPTANIPFDIIFERGIKKENIKSKKKKKKGKE